MLDYPNAVNAAFIHKYAHGGNLSSAERMNLRYSVARELFTQKYSHLTTELDKKAAEQHNTDADEWALILDGVSFAEDVPRCVFYLVNSLPFVHPRPHPQSPRFTLRRRSPTSPSDWILLQLLRLIDRWKC